MPLHLLGKKSWNVYNADNIAKVRRDEAQAKAREEEEEQRMQEVDAQRRIQLLRGVHTEPPLSLPSVESSGSQPVDHRPDRKRRKIAGEDDTERDLRLAEEHRTRDGDAGGARPGRRTTSDAPLTDHSGHISLFPEERSRRHVAKNPEAEAEAAKKKREFEDQYTMRFSNAAGFKQGLERPWYAKSAGPEKDGGVEESVGRDVWGNEDRGRKQREQRRVEDGDPLASMRRGVRDLKQVEKERQRWTEEREREMRELRRAERQSRRSRRSRDEDDGLEGFSLDRSPRDVPRTRASHYESDDGRRRRRGHSDRSRSKSPDESSHRHRHHRQRSSSPRTRRSGDGERGKRHRPTSSGGGLRTENQVGWEKGVGGRYSNQFMQA